MANLTSIMKNLEIINI